MPRFLAEIRMGSVVRLWCIGGKRGVGQRERILASKDYFGLTILLLVTDTLTIAERSRLMAKIKGKNTRPEIAVRSLLHRAGYRFRIHVASLPGKPDVVLPKYRTVIFVHGCFWHRHKGCKAATIPKSHRKFWGDKFARNVANDKKHGRQLRRHGWKVVTVWECQLRWPERVIRRVERVL